MKVSRELHALAVLIPKKSLQYLLRRRRGGYYGETKHIVEENNLLPLLGIEPWFCGHSACNLVTDYNILAVPCIYLLTYQIIILLNLSMQVTGHNIVWRH